MFHGLPTRSLTVGALLSGASSFTVPFFQRPYSWTPVEAGVLLENLSAAAGLEAETSAEDDYFLGMILLIERKVGNNRTATGEYGIVDGQQRLTTIAILAAVIRDMLDEMGPASTTATRLDALLDGRGSGNSERRYRIELNGRERQFLETYVLERKACWSMPTSDSLTPAETAIIDVREHFLDELKPFEPADLVRLAAYICDYCHVVAIYTVDIDRAHRDFMVLNGRGKPLQRNDILKAELLGAVAPAAAPATFAAWQAAAELTNDAFEPLFGHIRSIHGKTAIITSVREIVSEVGGAQAFIENELLPLARAHALIQSAGKPGSRIADKSTHDRLVYLSRLNGQDWMPAALLALKDYGRDAAHASAIVTQIDRLGHLLRLLLLSGGKRAPFFSALVKSIREDGLAAAARSPLVLTRDQTRSILFYIRDFYKRNPAMCKMLLLRLNDEIEGRLTPVDPADWSVEHVLPSRPSATADWRIIFSNSEERDACTKSLGNLVLVTKKQNTAARNASFARKQEIYRKNDKGLPVLRITQEVIDLKSWGPDDVRARERRLIGLIGRIWDIDVSNGQRNAAE